MLLIDMSAMVLIAILLFTPNIIKTNLYPIIATILLGMIGLVLVYEIARKEVNICYVLLGMLPFLAYVLILWLLQISLVDAEWLLVGLCFFVLETYFCVLMKESVDDKEIFFMVLNTVSYYLISFIRYANL